jgi:outer membrane protein TolC
VTEVRRAGLVTAAICTLVLAGCVTANPDRSVAQINQEAPTFTEGALDLARSPEDSSRRAAVAAKLLEAPLAQRDAVELALVNSPALQALLAQGWEASANAAQVGRIPNPLLSFERLAGGGELEVARAVSVGLLDLLTLPLRQRNARSLMLQAQLALTGDVVDTVTQVRQAWVRAVAAGQALRYARQVYTSAEAGAELARRMQAAGNFNRLSRAREQAFYADAGTRLAAADHQATATREALGRALGLDEAQMAVLTLPERLPDLPADALTPEGVGSVATLARLDIQIARSRLDAALAAQGLKSITSFTDIELTARRNSMSAGVQTEGSSMRGYEVAVSLPLFDWGGMQRSAINAQTLAAANHLEATVRAAGSDLRETYSAYRTAHEISRHYQEEVVPLRRVISEENQLRYNGMIIGVFELLADARDQVVTVSAALDAAKEFWLADAALQAALIGRPTNVSVGTNPAAAASSGAAH